MGFYGPEPDNASRAAEGEQLGQLQAELGGLDWGEEARDACVDAITNLMHFLESVGEDPEAAIAMAKHHYWEERAEEMDDDESGEEF